MAFTLQLLSKDELFYATNRCFANVGVNLKINFSHFSSCFEFYENLNSGFFSLSRLLYN